MYVYIHIHVHAFVTHVCVSLCVYKYLHTNGSNPSARVVCSPHEVNSREPQPSHHRVT